MKSSFLLCTKMQDPQSKPEELVWPVSRVRSTFIDFFVQKKEHLFVASSPVVPHDDPTLLFANAGMNQFKPIFLGQVDPKSEQATWKSAANTQKCIRAGGKHNDLDDVGKDTYHHTFFEMLGNWSFGHYFKKEAISWAWELLTEVYKLDVKKIYVTYFGGNKEDGLEADLEARDIWLNYLPPERVLPFGKKENFWEMGKTGPCGPCSEIHYDRLDGRFSSNLVNADDPTLIEIWNLVFIQFNREEDGSLRSLPAKHVDTGMGLERITSILQGAMSNYDTDVFTPLFKRIQEVTGARPYTGKVGEEDTDHVDMAYRVVADHVRTLSFAINDGAIPGAVGRNYVVRRILRRAVRYGKQILGAKDGFFHQLVPEVVQLMGDAFPELKKNPQHIIATIKEEEVAFARTLDKGIRKFNKATEKLESGSTIPGDVVFKLFDTYGFPVDLTVLMAEEKKLKVDQEGFKKLKKLARENSSGAATNAEAGLNLGTHAVAHLQSIPVAPTDDSFKYQTELEIDATVKAIWTGKEFVDTTTDATVGLVLDRTVFYAEQGGQIFDLGSITVVGKDAAQRVENVQVFGGYVVHMGSCKGTIKVGDVVRLSVDVERRKPTMSNHTSTHLINFALRKALGDHIEQRGSLVLPEKLRFDFSHNKALTQAQLEEVQRIVAAQIEQDLSVYAKEVPLKQALAISGIRAVFGEVYPDPVRVVSVGPSVDELLAEPSAPRWREYAVELCGGTHIARSSQATAFVIVGEDALARGIRRITSLTGAPALEAIQRAQALRERIAQAKALSGEALTEQIKQLLEAINDATRPIPAAQQIELRNLVEDLRKAAFTGQKNAKTEQLEAAQQYAEQIMESLGSSDQVHVGRLDVGSNVIALTNAIKAIRARHPQVAVLLISSEIVKGKPKVTVVTQVPDEVASQGLKANEWAAAVAQLLGGKGGGKPTTAQGSGTAIERIPEALQLALSFAQPKLQ